MAMLFNACEKEPLVIDEASSKSVSSGYWSKHLPGTYLNVLSDKIAQRDSVQAQPYPSLDLLLQIAGELEAADSADAFIEDMVDAFGIPLWNYSILKGSESSDYIVSIPFDRVTDDTTISGILKYYYLENEADFVFIARSELDSLIQSPPDTSAFGGYAAGIFFDFLIFEFNLFENYNLQLFDYLEEVANIQSGLVLPRTYFYCVKQEPTENIPYAYLQEGGTTLIAANLFLSLISQSFILYLGGEFYDCYIPDNESFDFYFDIGTNWRDWPEFFQWFLNNVGPGGGSGSGSGSGTPPPPPPPTPIELCLEGNFVLMAAADRLRDELVDACDPEFDADLAVDNALMAACDDIQTNQLNSFVEALSSHIGINKNLKSVCPRYSCILDQMISGQLGTAFLCGLTSPFEGTNFLLNINVTDFSLSPNLNPAAHAATFLDQAGGGTIFVNIFINSLNCTSTHVFEVFDALQHELIHADIKRRLVEDHGLTNLSPLSQAQAFHELVVKEYGGQAGTTEHDLMLEYYVDLMAASMLEANNNIGTLDLFRNLALYGLSNTALQYCSYDLQTVINNYNAFIIWANVPGNVSTEIAICI